MAYTTINKPIDYFNTVTYTGNGTAIGSGGNAITGVGFQPDWVWIKSRTQAEEHEVFDPIRGVTKYIRPSTTQAEVTDSESLTAFDADGFTVGNHGQINANSQSFVSWNWLASNSTASNSDGSITSSVSANTTSGFSIVSYIGNGIQDATVGHGLGTTPNMIIFKDRSIVKSWRVWHSGLSGSTYYLNLNDTFAESSSSTVINGQSSTTFTVGTDTSTNGSTNNMFAYCFAEKKGFSKFGSYTGNGNANGPMIYTGFKPAWVMLKSISRTGSWFIIDNKRSGYNGKNDLLFANLSDAEGSGVTYPYADLLSNGFKLITNATNVNESSKTYSYMAFAESPFTTSTGVPTTAR